MGKSLTSRPSKAFMEIGVLNGTTGMEKANTMEEDRKLPADPESRRTENDTGVLDRHKTTLIKNCEVKWWVCCVFITFSHELRSFVWHTGQLDNI